MIKRKKAEVESLVGGLDTFVSATEIEDSATPDCENVIPVGKGGIRTRQGRTAWGGEITENYAGQDRFIYVNSSNEIEELVVINGVLKKKNGDSWDTISGGTLSTTARICAAQVGDRLYFADGETALCYYDGTEITDTGVASAPLPSILISYNRRLYCNDVNNPDRYYFGGSLDTTTGDADDTGNFASSSPAYGGYAGFGLGKTIQGFAKLGGTSLIVGLKDGIHRVTPVADTGLSNALKHSEEQLSNSIGMANHFAIDNVENDLAFLSWSDIYLLGEVASYTSLRTRVASAKVSSLIQGIAAASLSKSAMLYSPVQRKLYLAYADGTSYNNKVLVYDTYHKSWWRYSGWNIASMTEHTDSSNNTYLIGLSSDSSDSYNYQLNNTSNDAGSAITWYWKSKVFDLKGFDILKKFKRWAILFGPLYGTITITAYIGGETNTTEVQIGSLSGSAGLGSTVLGSAPLGWDDNALVAETIINDWRWKKLSRPNEATNIQFKISGSGVSESGQVEKIKFYYNENERKKDRSKRLT